MHKKFILITTIVIIVTIGAYLWFMQKNLETKTGTLMGSKGATLLLISDDDEDVFVNINDAEQYMDKKIEVKGYLHEPKPCPPNLQCMATPTMDVKSIKIIN